MRTACTDQVVRAVWRSTLLGIPASTVLALILGSTVPTSRRVAYVAFVSVTDILTFAYAGLYLRRRRRGEEVASHWVGTMMVGLVSFAWGSLPLFGLPNAHHVELRAVYALFVCASSATYVVGTAGRRSYYFASQAPMLTLTTAAFVASPDHVTRLLGCAIPMYFFVMTSLHHEVHSVVLSELQLRERNDDVNEQLRDANRRLTREALHDGLTGLANRVAFTEQLERAVELARRSNNALGVLYFDIDRFKVVNDSLGHNAGDELLIEIAQRVRRATRGHDVIARLGGDEFTVLLHPLDDDAEAVVIAKRVADAFVEPFAIGGRELNVTASIGVATNLDKSDDAESLVSQADAAQYRAKQGGRNRIEVFDIELRTSIERRLDDEHELRTAMQNGEITAWFQPEVDLRTGRVLGAEALARWLHPTSGTLDAGRFVPLAQETGLVIALDNLVVRNAVEARFSLAERGADHDFRIWCNVSPEQFTRDAPAQRLEQLLGIVGCDPNHVGIEITESAILSDVTAAARELTAARDLGVKVALDDFGTGHSSLTLLRKLPLDKVKIDRSFVQEVTRDVTDAAIVRSVIGLAQELGLDVTAEGVETPDQAALLAEFGCRSAQGYLWSKAVPAADLAGFLEHDRAAA